MNDSQDVHTVEQEPERWKVKKEVSLADILSFLCAALAVVYAYTTLDKRLYLIEGRIAEQVVIDKRQDDDSIRAQARLESQFTTMNNKLDRLIERR